MHKADNLPPSCAIVMKSGNLNFLEPSGPLQACNGTALPLLMKSCHFKRLCFLVHWQPPSQVQGYSETSWRVILKNELKGFGRRMSRIILRCSSNTLWNNLVKILRISGAHFEINPLKLLHKIGKYCLHNLAFF